MDVIVAKLQTNYGILAIELLNPCEGPGRWFSQLVLAGQFNSISLNKIKLGSYLLGDVSYILDDTFYGEVEKECITALQGRIYKHVGAGLVSCSLPTPGGGIKDIIVTLSPQPELDGKCIIFGRIYDGMDLIKKAVEQRKGETSSLHNPIIVSSATISVRQRNSFDNHVNILSAELGMQQCCDSLLQQIWI